MRVLESVEIRSSPARVWAFVSDHGNDPLWCKKVEAVSAAGRGRWTVRHKPVPLRPPMTLTLEQLEAIPPSLLRLREEDEASVFEVTYRLQPVAQGTRLTQVSEFRWKRAPHVLQWVLARGVRRDVRGQLRDLRRMLESREASL